MGDRTLYPVKAVLGVGEDGGRQISGTYARFGGKRQLSDGDEYAAQEYHRKLEEA